MVPGCLTSESEERETWTAESLRAALFEKVDLHGKAFAGEVAGRDFGGLTFLGRTLFSCRRRAGFRRKLEACRCAHEKIVGPRQTL